MYCVIHMRGMKKYLIPFFCCVLAILLALGYIRFRYPLRYLDIIRANASSNGIAPSFVCAVIHAESKFIETAHSRKGASGLMQITPGTADWLAQQMGLPDYSYENIYDPEVNVEIGCYYLAWLLNYYHKDADLTAAAYNAGIGNVNKWLQNASYSADGQQLDYIPFRETRDYVRRVRWNQKIYDLILKIYK